jgi:hypothetical protein
VSGFGAALASGRSCALLSRPMTIASVGGLCAGCGGLMTDDTPCRFVSIEVDSDAYPWGDTRANDFCDSDEMGAWLCEPCLVPVLALVERVMLVVNASPVVTAGN